MAGGETILCQYAQARYKMQGLMTTKENSWAHALGKNGQLQCHDHNANYGNIDHVNKEVLETGQKQDQCNQRERLPFCKSGEKDKNIIPQRRMMAVEEQCLDALLVKQKAYCPQYNINGKYPEKKTVFLYELARHNYGYENRFNFFGPK